MNDMPVPHPVIVGLVGYPRSGKDCLGDMLEDTGRWKKVAFADAMKDAYLAGRPCRWYEDEIPETGEEGYFLPIFDRAGLELAKVEDAQTRHSLQRFGQVIREMDEDFWVFAAAKTVGQYMAEGFNVILTDIRYPNELQFVQRKGMAIGIHRDSARPVNDHVSERNTTELLEQVDFTIRNQEDATLRMFDQFERCTRRFFGGAV